ncbi:hypothetical protein P154DRAFT_264881 [Amniculicola lignicola CBS 123094]|uniref:Uncharacterized protein n=1 Tax=Amniculicola lignicola CBS 123094 TaxID=1392246 RepID=A0A6A5WAR8_9PLEO|nr:hypothetical protein P154DRAFT_264881 [Amniculicola lignicola CBS 123094]
MSCTHIYMMYVCMYVRCGEQADARCRGPGCSGRGGRRTGAFLTAWPRCRHVPGQPRATWWWWWWWWWWCWVRRLSAASLGVGGVMCSRSAAAALKHNGAWQPGRRARFRRFRREPAKGPRPVFWPIGESGPGASSRRGRANDVRPASRAANWAEASGSLAGRIWSISLAQARRIHLHRGAAILSSAALPPPKSPAHRTRPSPLPAVPSVCTRCLQVPHARSPALAPPSSPPQSSAPRSIRPPWQPLAHSSPAPSPAAASWSLAESRGPLVQQQLVSCATRLETSPSLFVSASWQMPMLYHRSRPLHHRPRARGSPANSLAAPRLESRSAATLPAARAEKHAPSRRQHHARPLAVASRTRPGTLSSSGFVHTRSPRRPPAKA